MAMPTIKSSLPQLKQVMNPRQGKILVAPTHQFLLAFAICLGMIFIGNVAFAQESDDGIWEVIHDLPAERAASKAWIRPQVATIYNLDRSTLKARLSNAPMEFDTPNVDDLPILTIPMPNGTYARFRFEESPIMHPDLAAKYPDIKTYLGQGIDDPSASIRFDETPSGFHAQILSPNGAVYVDPYSRGDTQTYSSYYKKDYQNAAKQFQCLTEPTIQPGQRPQNRDVLQRSGTTLKTYRLAVAATTEYTAFHGGKTEAINAIATTVNRVTGIYEIELAVQFVLVGDNDMLVFTDTDEYINDNAEQLLTKNQMIIDRVILAANYDIGHVVGTGAGGLATSGVCQDEHKAKGVTGGPSPMGDPFDVDFVAHEIGHQFNANHTWSGLDNGLNSSCGGGNYFAATAMEPGSGSTIMAYAGICDTQNLQNTSDPYFHSASFDEILTYITTGPGAGCGSSLNNGNTVPSVNAGADYTIPKQTPFTLTGTASDTNGDSLTYCWEQRDTGPQQAIADADNGSSPLFRSFPPVTSESRTFPKLSDILGNTATIGEKLPTLARAMNFRLTVRDNRAGGGGVNTDDMVATVDASSGPFLVTSPNTAVTLPAGTQTITWNVANTATTPVNATNVNILLSTDSGTTFLTTLVSNTPNDGSQSVTLPNMTTSTARIKVEAVGNVFFDVSNTNFSIQSVASALTVNIVADSISETAGTGATMATVTRNSATNSVLTVALVSSDTTEATVQTTVEIANGETTSPAFNINAIDDAIADGNQTVTITASATGHTNGTDTVDVNDNETALLTVNIVANSISETAGAGATMATVTRNSATNSVLTVTLASSDTTEATVQTTVDIANGETISPAFNINAIDDAIADGNQTVTITASATGHTNGTDTVDVNDNETATLTVSIVAASISEAAGTGATMATVTRNSATNSVLTVTLASSDTTEASVQTTVEIANGETASPAFNINAIDDAIVDGNQTVTITASATGHTNGTDTVDVNDNDTATLMVNIVANSISEAAGTGATMATVTRDSATTSVLTVTLASSDTTEATVQTSVDIADGETTSPAFNINAVNDGNVDGNQTVTITATATGHANGTDTVVVNDNDTTQPTVTVFLDNNQNGTQDSGETGVSGVNLTLLHSANLNNGGGNADVAVNIAWINNQIGDSVTFEGATRTFGLNAFAKVQDAVDRLHLVRDNVASESTATDSNGNYTFSTTNSLGAFVIKISEPGNTITPSIISGVSNSVDVPIARNIGIQRN